MPGNESLRCPCLLTIEYNPMHVTTATITETCAGCGKPIEPGMPRRWHHGYPPDVFHAPDCSVAIDLEEVKLPPVPGPKPWTKKGRVVTKISGLRPAMPEIICSTKTEEL